MVWSHYVAYFFGGIFFANAIPHWVSGSQGRPFQSPFATPHGEGLSTSTLNTLWGALNFGLAYILLVSIGGFDYREASHVVAAGIPAIALTVILARRFGRFNGGNAPP